MTHQQRLSILFFVFLVGFIYLEHVIATHVTQPDSEYYNPAEGCKWATNITDEKEQDDDPNSFFLDTIWADLSTLALILERRGWREFKWNKNRMYLMKASWLWSWSSERLARYAQFNPCQIINQFPNGSHFTNKNTLLHALKEHYHNDSQVFDIIPPTFDLAKQEEYHRFIEYGPFPEYSGRSSIPTQIETSFDGQQQQFYSETDHNDNNFHSKNSPIWIMKQSEQNRGVGIHLVRSLTDVHEIMDINDYNNRTSTNRISSGVSKQYIIQKYIENPLLLEVDGEQFKFDIRQFVVITSGNPVIVWLHDLCYLRLATSPYSNNDIKNRYKHLTNHQVQKLAGKTNISLDNSTQSCSYLQDSLKQKLGQEKGEESFHQIQSQIQNLVIKVMKTWPPEDHRDNTFQMLGFDFIVDKNLKVWLLEVNHNPGLFMTTPVVAQHHESLLESIVTLMLDEYKWNHRISCNEQSDNNNWNSLPQVGTLKRIYCGSYHSQMEPVSMRSFESSLTIEKLDE
eukprot:gb/GECH01007035.1/.p1 GENE.gb/GECH01007035.1/~~gb/GECH01007035.1/.p1  ORF type:complete len:511 (+),score=115.68 gb/GECH01007035.1/:1-1533(+)